MMMTMEMNHHDPSTTSTREIPPKQHQQQQDQQQDQQVLLSCCNNDAHHIFNNSCPLSPTTTTTCSVTSTATTITTRTNNANNNNNIDNDFVIVSKQQQQQQVPLLSSSILKNFNHDITMEKLCIHGFMWPRQQKLSTTTLSPLSSTLCCWKKQFFVSKRLPLSFKKVTPIKKNKKKITTNHHSTLPFMISTVKEDLPSFDSSFMRSSSLSSAAVTSTITTTPCSTTTTTTTATTTPAAAPAAAAAAATTTTTTTPYPYCSITRPPSLIAKECKHYNTLKTKPKNSTRTTTPFIIVGSIWPRIWNNNKNKLVQLSKKQKQRRLLQRQK